MRTHENKLHFLKMRTFVVRFIVTLALLILGGCGEGKIVLSEDTYEPKIVVQGYLFPGQPVEEIYIFRNFRVDRNIGDLTLPDAIASITDLSTGNVFPLTYRPDSAWFFDSSQSLRIHSGNSYELRVSATIDGEQLETSTTTTVPASDLEIVGINHDTLRYYERDANQELQYFRIDFQRSPGIDMYTVAVTAQNAVADSFIYDNVFEEFTEEDVLEDIDDFRFADETVLNTPTSAGISDITIFWFDVWFYGRYQAIVYAADKNYRNYELTHGDVQEIDGNFHDPVFHFEGDGIGVFGSAATDTIYFEVTR